MNWIKKCTELSITAIVFSILFGLLICDGCFMMMTEADTIENICGVILLCITILLTIRIVRLLILNLKSIYKNNEKSN